MSRTLESAEWVAEPEVREAERADYNAAFEAAYGPRPSDAQPLPIVWA